MVTDNNGCLAYDTIPYTVACNSSTDLNISTSEACVNDTVYLITSSINTQWSSSFENLSVLNNIPNIEYSHYFTVLKSLIQVKQLKLLLLILPHQTVQLIQLLILLFILFLR